MRYTLPTLALVLSLLAVEGCDNSTTTTTTTNPDAARVQQDLRQAGSELKDAAATAGQELKPALQKAGAEARQGINAAANKIADLTATRPATQP